MLPPKYAESAAPLDQAAALREATPCQSCGSGNRRKFGGELAIHFRGLKNLDNPHVYVCTELSVCLDCGAAQFAIQEAERRLLREGDQQVPPPSH